MKHYHTQNEILKLSKPGRYLVDRTLFFNIAPGGSRSWVQRIMDGSKQREVGLGGFPLVSYQEAKKKALQNRLKKRTGESLETARGIPTFQEMTLKTIEQKRLTWKHPDKQTKQWMGAFKRHVFPFLGHRKVSDIKAKDVFDVLMLLCSRKRHDQADHMRRNIQAVMQTALMFEYVTVNPVLNIKLPAHLPTHFKAFEYQDLPELLKQSKAWGCNETTKVLLEFQVLTATRPSEARQAEWNEIDLETGLWTIPSHKMKMGKSHRIPLSGRAIELLQDMASRNVETPSNFVFSLRGKGLNPGIINDALKAHDIESTAHGFRSAFRSWCADNDVSFEVAEMCLSHVQNKTVRAYQRSDLLEARRHVMQRWADYLIQ